MRLILPLLALLVPALAWPAAGGTRFDGRWVGQAKTDYGHCSPYYDLDVRIVNGRLSGLMTSNTAHYTISASIDETGRIEGVFAYGGDAVIKVRVRLGERDGYGSWYGHEETRRSLGFGGSLLFGGRERDICDGSLRLSRETLPPPAYPTPRP
jgi:hypothetical protein